MRPSTRAVRTAVALTALLGVAAPACRAGDGTPPAPTAGAAATEDAVVVHATAPASLGTSADTWAAGEVTFTTVDGQRHVIATRVADTPERRQQGLMRVATLPPGTGMLFVFDGAREGGFWMKDTPVPLDIAYVADGEVVAVLQMDPCVDYAAPGDCPSYDPGVAYDAAVEVAQGWFAAHDVGVGAQVSTTPAG